MVGCGAGLSHVYTLNTAAGKFLKTFDLKVLKHNKKVIQSTTDSNARNKSKPSEEKAAHSSKLKPS